MKKFIIIALCSLLYLNNTSAQQAIPISLNNLADFESYGDSWITASAIDMNYIKAKSTLIKGDGIIVSVPEKDNKNLVSKSIINGDTEIDFDFMSSKDSRSAVYIAGRYKILLSDSWTTQDPLSMIGVVELNADKRNSTFHTSPPLTHVVKAPGLWQHLKIKYRAPKFDGNLQKKQHAVFEEVYLNGVLIQQDLILEQPSIGALFSDENKSGPLVFQSDGEHRLALKNISYRELPELEESNTKRKSRSLGPIIVNPDNSPYLLRSYLLFEGNKRTHAISIGNPDQTNYSYDLKQGSVLQLWRGLFVDATEMWEGRGEPQLAKPLGAIINLTSAPSIAKLSDKDALWPDSIPFNDFHNKGYSLNRDNSVSFNYEYEDVEVVDKIISADNGRMLNREISINGSPDNLYFRIANGKDIRHIGKGLYFINNQSYYIKVKESLKPVIRTTPNEQELIIPFSRNLSRVEYSIIW